MPEAGTTVESQGNHDSSDSYEKEAPIVDLGIPANLPPNYIADLPIRLSLYQKISGLKTHDDVTSVNEELADRFAKWYYVVSAGSYNRVHKNRDDLLKEIEAEEAAGAL